MTTVRTVTTVQTSGGGPPGDSNLDALLEDLQTSVGRTPAINGVSGGNTKIYREVTRTVKHETQPGYHHQQVEYLQPANTTTVVAEREPSPGIEYITTQQSQPGVPGVTTYKTISYEYNTGSKTQPMMVVEDPVQDGRLRQTIAYEYNTGSKTKPMMVVDDPAQDARLRQNLTELDSLLVDLHQAQKTGFSADQGNVRPADGSNTDAIVYSTSF